ncbi:hypothetical protein [Aestuariibius sp. HNIBRBA575]|uniref:hypothetical protein n=1 Tax=Aestuariibius sp. HNIBRBA575 TaxID=3233343 RepID=UPI0034A51D73
MHKVKIFLFALRQMSEMGIWMAGAEFAGGEIRRQRAMAHKALYSKAMDAVIDRPTLDE